MNNLKLVRMPEKLSPSDLEKLLTVYARLAALGRKVRLANEEKEKSVLNETIYYGSGNVLRKK